MRIAFISKDIMNPRLNCVYYVFSDDRLVRIDYETQNGSDHTDFTYDSLGALTSVQDPIGHKVSYTYSGKTVTVTETPGSVVKHSEVTEIISSATPARIWNVVYGGNTRVTKDGQTTVIGFSLRNKYAYSFTDKSDGSDVDKLNVTDDIEAVQTIELEPGQSTYENILTGTTKKCGTVRASIISTWTAN